jgi:uncharacterized protein DUF6537
MNAWKAKLARLAAEIRSNLAELMGEDDDSPPCLPNGLSDAVKPIVIEAVHGLMDYQGAGYAQLYLDRLKRFVGRRNVDDTLLSDIAQRMATRMSYDDPIRMAQLKLAEVEIRQNRPQDTFAEDVRKLRLDEMVSSLPGKVADPVLYGLEWAGWLHRPVTRRFSTESRWSIRRLKIEASLRRWRLHSVRYAKERVWVERWLHMIDRSLIKQPEAASAIVQSATMVQGYGHAYRQGLADWNLIIDGLAKPTFDGTLKLSDLAGALAEARAAALPDPRHAALKRAIAQIRAKASAGDAGAKVRG